MGGRGEFRVRRCAAHVFLRGALLSLLGRVIWLLGRVIVLSNSWTRLGGISLVSGQPAGGRTVHGGDEVLL